MYGVVLAMALVGTAEVPDCHFGHGGCCGQSFGGGCGFGGGGCFSSCGCFGNRGGCGFNNCNNGCNTCNNCNYVSNCGCQGGMNGGMYGAPIMTPEPPAQKMPGEKIGEPKKGLDLSNLPTPGTIVVTLPSDAKLTIDGYVSQQTSGQRVLVTPPIQRGQDLTYTLVAESTQDGQVVRQSQQVTVRAGQQMPVSFTFATAPAAASR
jgi:uncharacterized protein (TIGR03000 family)